MLSMRIPAPRERAEGMLGAQKWSLQREMEGAGMHRSISAEVMSPFAVECFVRHDRLPPMCLPCKYKFPAKACQNEHIYRIDCRRFMWSVLIR